MLRLGRFAFGVFFTKQDLDYTNKRVAIGFRVAWRERQFCDVYLYNSGGSWPLVHNTTW